MAKSPAAILKSCAGVVDHAGRQKAVRSAPRTRRLPRLAGRRCRYGTTTRPALDRPAASRANTRAASDWCEGFAAQYVDLPASVCCCAESVRELRYCNRQWKRFRDWSFRDRVLRREGAVQWHWHAAVNHRPGEGSGARIPRRSGTDIHPDC